MPPKEGQLDDRAQMPSADVLVISCESDGVFLFRYTADGEFGGDTWHQEISEAKEQAEFEFGAFVGPWREVPAQVEDVVSFALTTPDEAAS